MYYDIRAQEVKQELDRMEQQRLRNQLRNESLLQKVQETLEATQRNEALHRAKDQLEEAKRQFLRDLNKRDPLWRDKMRARRLEEIKRLEQHKQQVMKELDQRQIQLQQELELNKNIRNLREEISMQHDRMNEAERHLRNIELENEIRSKTRELEELERKIKEQRLNDQDYNEKEGLFREFDSRNLVQDKEERKENFNSANTQPKSQMDKKKTNVKEELKNDQAKPAPHKQQQQAFDFTPISDNKEEASMMTQKKLEFDDGEIVIPQQKVSVPSSV